MAQWSSLYSDPLVELRLIAMERQQPSGSMPFGPPPGSAVLRRLGRPTFKQETLPLVEPAGLAGVWDRAVDMVFHSPILSEALANASVDANPGMAVAKALVAQAIVLAERQGGPPPHGDLRDELQRALAERLGGTVYGPADWLKRFLPSPSMLGSALVKHERLGLMESNSALGNDILAYQANGDGIRNFIRRRIDAVAGDGPVVILAHSLGGIASFELLASRSLEAVKGLITVGSQAPYLYEIGALAKLGFGVSLPGDFPPWLNIYDRLDFLSFVGEALFPGRVQDVEVDSRQPFPVSHSAYWSNPQTWTAVAPFLEQAAR